MDADRSLPWLRLKAVSGIGDLLFTRLIRRFSDPAAVFAAKDRYLLEVTGMTPRLISCIRRQAITGEILEDLERVRKKGCRLLTQNDPDYPQLLLEIPDPPPVLYVIGEIRSDRAAVAVVGSRNATGYGLETTGRLSRQLAQNGITVVSGMARGIDTAAHEGTLDAGGRTIAVMGCGLDTVYPPENRRLFHRIAEHGAVISEFPMAAGPDPHHFPRRNRIISGLTLGTVVVEATHRSGSLITARMALEQGREVFAVPGSVHSFKSTGTHSLIKQGARLVESVADILDELPRIGRVESAAATTRKPVAPPLSETEAAVVAAIGPYERQFDELVRTLAIPAGRLSGLLLQLELKGVIRQSAGKRFSVASG
ncbi:MAG: DNA-processing protein DprA [Desulfobacterales bacterium]